MANVNGTAIDLAPTDGMKIEAQRYRDWKSEGRAGGTEVAATRAGQILSADELSPETVITMAAWFARHEVDKQGQGFSPGEDGYPSPGRVAWAAWGGDPGQSWSITKANRIKNLQDREMDSARPYPNEHAARLHDPGQYDELRCVNDEGGSGVDFIYGIKAGKSEIQAIRFDAQRFTAAEARKWLTDHDFNAIGFEEATGKREMTSDMTAKQGLLYEALETASAAQEEPLSIVISTQAPTDADLLSLLMAVALARVLDALTLGEATAQSLGVPLRPARLLMPPPVAVRRIFEYDTAGNAEALRKLLEDGAAQAVGVMDRQILADHAADGPSALETAYRDASQSLLGMVADGTFPGLDPALMALDTLAFARGTLRAILSGQQHIYGKAIAPLIRAHIDLRRA